jgi:CheY-like chemotaxis protein
MLGEYVMSNHIIKNKILYVDDDPILRQTVPFVLEQEDLLVRTASNGQEGVEMALEWLPDLILMDLMMPIMDGFQATEALRADPRTQQTPILAFTGVADASGQAMTQAAGMNGFISKSTSLFDLVKTLGAYLK